MKLLINLIVSADYQWVCHEGKNNKGYNLIHFILIKMISIHLKMNFNVSVEYKIINII